MKIKNLLIPDEWLAAAEAGHDLWETLAKTAHGVAKTFWSLLIPFALGSAFFYLFNKYVHRILILLDGDLLRAALTILAILCGFMITTILFTGKPNGLSALNSDELQIVRDKVSYLVLSQCITLVSHIISSLFCLFSVAISADGTQLPLWVGVVWGGLICNSLLRAMILPLQIWEVHAFALDVEISERLKSEQARLRD